MSNSPASPSPAPSRSAPSSPRPGPEGPPAGAAIDGPVAVVTGASRGIGAHLARGLVADGWRVAGLSRSGDAPDDAAWAIACDVTDGHEVDRGVQDVVTTWGGIDLLVNNAGLVEDEVPIWEVDPDQWWQVVETNVRGPFLLTHAVVANMVAAGGGRIVNINSGSAGRANPLLTAYTASKAALARITGGTAAGGAEHGVMAFDMAPGVVRTDMTRAMDMHEGRTDWTDPDDVIAMLLALASGELDAWSGRMVRVGADTPASLRARAAEGLADSARTIGLRGYGPDDPLA